MRKYIGGALVCVLLLSGCTNRGYKIAGTIDGAGDSTVLLIEEPQGSEWLTIDSVKTTGDGNFSYSGEAPAFPSIYRLRQGSQSIYFPVDSVTNLKINSRVGTFARDYTLTGSPAAEAIMKIDKRAIAFASGNAQSGDYAAWKDSLAHQVVSDPTGIVAYYVISKNINGAPIFDPNNDKDLKIIGAVANSFNSFLPNDPRTPYLVSVLKEGQHRQRSASPTDTIYANETRNIDIRLQDYKGVEHSLTQVAEKNSITLLSFTIYEGDFSPAYNKVLNDLYKQYHSQGLEIYQVSLDEDNVLWRQAAENLPWITVYDGEGIYSTNVGAYNVTAAPTTFILRSGDIIERNEDATTLKAAVSKLF